MNGLSDGSFFECRSIRVMVPRAVIPVSPGLVQNLLHSQRIPAMRSHEIRSRPDGHYPCWIDGFVTLVIMALDMLHIHSFRDAGELEYLPREAPDIGVIHDPALVAFEVAVIDLVKTHER